MKPRYEPTPQHTQTFSSIVLLEMMLNQHQSYPEKLEGSRKFLQPLLQWMVEKELLKIETKHYVPDVKGRELLKKFIARYTEYLSLYDIYCAVDLTAGEFAFARYFEFDNDEDWKLFLQDDRWEDLRVAIAEFKKLDPIEIVFMSFVNEGRFDTTKPDWEIQLMDDTIWQEIVDICNSNLSWQELGYDNVPAEAVVKDIIKQGTELMFKLRQEEDERKKAAEEENGDDSRGGTSPVVEETYVKEEIIVEPYPLTYYEPYYDPYYVSDIWLISLLLL